MILFPINWKSVGQIVLIMSSINVGRHLFYGHLARQLRGLTFFMGIKFSILQ